MFSTSDAAALIGDSLLGQWRQERTKLDVIDRWARWDHDDPHKPKQATAEYRELAARAQAPWGDLIVSSVAQTLYIEGYRRPDQPTDSTGWDIWQANGMDARQVAINRAVLTYGIAYGLVLPGTTLAGDPMPMMRGVSPREMHAVYADPAWDEWPVVAIRVKAFGDRHRVWLYDDEVVHTFDVDGTDGRPMPAADPAAHGVGRCPVVRWTNRFDLEGRCAGEVEPFIPLLGSVDQTKFDRLVVQRFGAWIVRTIAGMSLSESAAASGSTAEQVKMRLRVEDFLVAEDTDTKFGSLPASPLDGYIKAHESDLTTLAAVSQTPAYELLGQMANLSAEALAAARASLTAKSDERKHTYGEAYEQFIRLACHVAGDTAGASDFNAQVRWADTSIRSIAQAVDAFGKLVTMLGFPAEVLWPKVPGMTQQDVDEAKVLAEQRGGMDALLADLVSGATSVPPAPDPVV
jgi:hypothetical protein